MILVDTTSGNPYTFKCLLFFSTCREQIPTRKQDLRFRDELTMAKAFWTITEVVEHFQISEGFLSELEEEEIVCSVCRENDPNKLFASEDLERLRLAKILVEEMGVNLAGVEVILGMRQRMIEMRRQFDDIFQDLAGHIQEKLGPFKT